jgi:hypothetical protein
MSEDRPAPVNSRERLSMLEKASRLLVQVISRQAVRVFPAPLGRAKMGQAIAPRQPRQKANRQGRPAKIGRSR